MTCKWKRGEKTQKEMVGERKGELASRTLASLCVAKIYCKIQFPVFIAHFQQHLLSLRVAVVAFAVAGVVYGKTIFIAFRWQ